MERHTMDKVLITVVLLLICQTFNVRSQVAIDRNLRIVGGSVARAGQFPHTVALILHLVQSRSSFCGGSIIHQNFVLTAAHCLDDVSRVEVLAGVHTIFRGTPQYRQSVLPQDFRQHPAYNRATLLNDIALIHVARRIPLNNLMQTIALPPRSHATNRFIGASGTVVGWGRISDAPGSGITDALRFVSLPIIPDRQCQEVYNNQYRYFNPTNICIDGTRGSSCNGDSGGAMHVTINGKMTIIGIVSYGSATCETGHPPVMTRVTSYLDWIENNSGVRLV